MVGYVGEKGAGRLIGQSFSIYFRNFKKIYPIFLVIYVPVGAMVAWLQIGDPSFLQAMSGLLIFFGSILGVAAVTVAVSDICLGNPTGIGRAYERAFSGMVGKLVGTYLLLVLCLVVGFVLLIVPGLVLSAMLIVVMPVVVMERRGGWQAMKRSMDLGKGKHLRNFGVLIVVGLAITIFNFLASFGVGYLAADIWPEIGRDMYYGRAEFGVWFVVFLGTQVAGLLAPIQSVTPVLMYYDLRSRKEAYDLMSLENDLMH